MVSRLSRNEEPEDPFHPSNFVVEEPAGHHTGFQVRFDGDQMLRSTIGTSIPTSRSGQKKKDHRDARQFYLVVSGAVVTILSLFLAFVFQYSLQDFSLTNEASQWTTYLEASLPDLTNLVAHLPGRASRQFIREVTRRTIGRRDYAFGPDGARIAPDITTGTFHLSSRSVSSHPAEVILRDNLHGGRCWSIPGQEGQVGIVAAERFHPTHITVDHVPRDLADDIQQAPRRMRAWAYVEGSQDREKAHKFQGYAARVEGDGPSVKGSYETFIHIADFEYDLHARHHIQTFPVYDGFREVDLDYGIFVIEVLDNWGSESTCIYRIRLHGYPTSTYLAEWQLYSYTPRSLADPPFSYSHTPEHPCTQSHSNPTFDNARTPLLSQQTLFLAYTVIMMHTQFPSDIEGRYPPGYFPQGMPVSQPPPSRSPPSQAFYDNGYQRFVPQRPPAGGEHTGQLYPSIPNFMPHIAPPRPPQPPSPPGNHGASSVHPFQAHTFNTQPVNPPQHQYPYGSHPQGHAAYRSVPFDNAASYGHPPSHPSTYAYSNHLAPTYTQPAPAPPAPGYVAGSRRSPTATMPSHLPASNDVAPPQVPTYGHNFGPVPAGPYAGSAGRPPAPDALDRTPAPGRGPAPARPLAPASARSPPRAPTQASSLPPPQTHVTPPAASDPKRTSPTRDQGSASRIHPTSAPASQFVSQEPISITWIPEGINVRGSIPPPSLGVLFDMLGGDVSLEEQLMVWYSLTDMDRMRLVSEHKNKSQPPVLDSAAGSTQGGTTHLPSTSLKRSKGKAKATLASPKSTGGSSILPGGQASGTYRSPYVQDYYGDDVDGSYTGPHNFQQSISSSIHPGYPQPRSSHPTPAAPPTAPTGPQGNHFGVVMLDAINGLQGKVVRIETILEDLIQSHPADLPLPHRASAIQVDPRTSSKQHGRRATKARRRGGNGYTADEEEEEREEQRLKAELDAQKARDRPHVNRLRECIRKHMKYVLLKVKSTKVLPQKYPPLTAEELEAYNNGAWGPISRATFRVDFVAGWKTNEYNVDARLFFLEDFVRETKGGMYSSPPIPRRFLSPDVVAKALDSHVDYLRRRYKEYAGPMTPERHLKLQRNAERKRVNARKATTYKVRMRTIDRHDLVQHKLLFQMLKPCHMSGDEAEVENEQDDRQTHPRVYIIVDAEWQSQEFKTFVRTLEEWNIADWRQSVGSRLPGGNAPRTRIEKGQTRVVDSIAPAGLWKNCYSQTWLDSLTGPVRARLDIIHEAYDFSLPVYEKPAYVDPKDFPVPEEEDAAAEAEMDDDDDDSSEEEEGDF